MHTTFHLRRTACGLYYAVARHFRQGGGLATLVPGSVASDRRRALAVMHQAASLTRPRSA